MSCGVDSNHFKLSGRFLNMNQGEFYVYSPEGGIDGIDTIHVVGGRFTYERPCDHEMTLMLVFPNFSQQPIFAEPGKSVEVKSDASNMKEMEVSGTDANELMTKFRLQTAHIAPPDVTPKAVEFIESHLDSPVSLYLLRTYFIQAPRPDYAQAEKLTKKMLEKQPKNGTLIIIQQQLKQLSHGVAGTPMPHFSGYGFENVPPRFAIDHRNRWMINQSEFVVTYVRSPGGAAKFKALAERKGKTVLEISERSL